MNRFRLSDTTTLFIEEGDLTKADVDVIVNAAHIAIDVAQAHAGRLARTHFILVGDTMLRAWARVAERVAS